MLVSVLCASLTPLHSPASLQVNNAAAFWLGKLEDVTPEDWMKVLQTNVIGYSNQIQAALPHFKEQGKGVVVNLSSMSACK